ncbi:MAG: 1-acyl-sn-glycerol-3-phosphate acyltransferase [Cyclobacteriaceae bacterium]|nr:1-acyl-sn-glycerol-3-phosphate acyltransferase [Cyclobacteriaceae bacterium]
MALNLIRPVKKVDTKKRFEPIHAGSQEWPVVQLARNRKQFVQQVTNEAVDRLILLRSGIGQLVDEIEKTRYHEKLRIKTNPWKVDPEDELIFWGKVKSRLLEIDKKDGAEAEELAKLLLKDIVNRYAEEITGNFKQTSYKLARNIVTFGFARLLNAAKIKKFGSFFRNEYTLQDKIQITGEVEHLRALARIGTIVMVPTHFSNLDSITLGYIINELGLPPFIYGAGLNLFNVEIFAYFMNSLGAYKVDRRKKNLIYLETLRTYSSLAIRKGNHSLFFPGGTRSRAGNIETRLKLGLLGTAIEAQRINYENNTEGRASKIFVVPVVINYNFVLEAPSLINDYLELKGQERYYVENDDFTSSGKILKFLIKFFTQGSNISVSIGKGMDLFGNYVDQEGKSIDKFGNYVNTREYFSYRGKINRDTQREEEYTRMLSIRIVDEYLRINQVFASHLVPFVAFEMLKKKYPDEDLYGLLRIPLDEVEIPYEIYRETFGRLRDKIFDMYNRGQIDIAPHLTGDLDQVIGHGIYNVGLYHARRPVIKSKNGNITSQDLTTLYYYRNRMDGYDLEKYI